MNVRVKKSEICGSVEIPPSKSVAHRMMIAAALSGSFMTVGDGGKDVAATEGCLKVMSPAIERFRSAFYDGGAREEDLISAHGDYATLNADSEDGIKAGALPVLNAGESGSTLRFLLPVACALGFECVITGEGRLKDRPLSGLVRCLEERGANLNKIGESQLPLRVLGRLSAGVYIIDGGVSSQYITGLLFALPLLDGDSRIRIKGELVSAAYVDITLSVLEDFGVEILREREGFYVRGNQKYTAPKRLKVEGDWSSAAFMLALGVLAGETAVCGLNPDSRQGDKVVAEFLRKAGADISLSGSCAVARKSALSAIDFDCTHCPDVVPIMAAALSFAAGASHISGVDRLRDKESDRLAAVMDMLADFGIRTEYENNVLTVFGSEHKACRTRGFSDHRMAMSAIVTAIATEGESVVEGVECISKSYPTFIEHAQALGADIKIGEADIRTGKI